MKRVAWPDFLTLYLDDRRSLGRSEETLRGYRRALLRFADFLGDRAEAIQDVQPEHLEGFRAHLQRLPRISASGVHHEMRSVVIALRWAVRQGWLLLDPSAGLVLPRLTPAPPLQLTEEEVVALLEAPSAVSPRGLRDRAILELFYGTGLRHAEVLALDLADLDLSRRHLTVRRGKGGRPRRVPLGPHLVRVLVAYLERSRPLFCRELGEPALFVSGRGQRLSSHGLSKMIRGYTTQKGLAPHALRRAFATHLLERGARLGEVKNLLGHRCIGSTEGYCGVQPEALERELRRTHPRARRPRGRKATP